MNKMVKCINAKWTASPTTLQEKKITCTRLTFPYSHFSLVKNRCCLLLSSQLVGCYHQQYGSS